MQYIIDNTLDNIQNMKNIIEYVPSNEIWPTSKSYIDKGYRSGLVRGYNVEVIDSNGKLSWFSCEYIHGEPDEELFDDFHQFWYSDCGVKPTGRISFRGYGREQYNVEDHETYIIDVEA